MSSRWRSSTSAGGHRSGFIDLTLKHGGEGVMIWNSMTAKGVGEMSSIVGTRILLVSTSLAQNHKFLKRNY